MKRYIMPFVCGVILTINVGLSFGFSTAKLTLKAVEESGVSIAGAVVNVYFWKAKDEGTGLRSIKVHGSTDTQGTVTFQGEGMESVGATVDKEGYYQSNSGYKFNAYSKQLNRWEPWNPTVEVILKKKHNPVAMFSKYTGKLVIPKFDTPIGFDLEKGDLVSPYGKGIVSDFIFTFHSTQLSFTDYECSVELTFTNKYDGIQEFFFDEEEQSYYKWPFEAPENGYLEGIELYKSFKPGKGLTSNRNIQRNHIFRVRTKINKEGNVIETKYGKIKGDFALGPNGSVVFSYFFNPDGTRNLEEDPEKNLFKK